jgi:pyridinium-3,5-bisthiocarboxylic acid mononucleotide nickel chelatase
MSLVIRLDAVGGVAGDMFVAAMIDALPDLRDRVLSDVRAALPTDAGEPVFETGTSAGLHCMRFRLSSPSRRAHDHHDQHDHASFRGMVGRMEAAALAPGTADNAIAILRLLAETEAGIHHVAIEDVHFHEIGDWDSLMDVIAAGSIVAALHGARWSVSALPRGDGLVRTRHGLLPVPAPATVRLLEGFAWRDDGIGGERVTPTGAAILRHLIAHPAGASAPLRVEGRLKASGTGAGTREFPGQPNILRAMVFDPITTDARSADAEDILIASFEIDDMTGEELAVAADRLRAVAGVRDLVLIPALGKKGRPVHTFRLLVDPDEQDSVTDACFIETSTIGLRWQSAQRAVLPRSGTRSGEVRVKTVRRPAGPTRKAESDDLAPIAGLEARRSTKRSAELP